MSSVPEGDRIGHFHPVLRPGADTSVFHPPRGRGKSWITRCAAPARVPGPGAAANPRTKDALTARTRGPGPADLPAPYFGLERPVPGEGPIAAPGAEKGGRGPPNSSPTRISLPPRPAAAPTPVNTRQSLSFRGSDFSGTRLGALQRASLGTEELISENNHNS